MVFIFQDKGYQVGTIASFNSALVEPLRIGFDLDLNVRIFALTLRSMWLKCPGRPFIEPAWDLDSVLVFIMSDRFTLGNNYIHLIMKCIFLLGIALGCHISEFLSLRRGSRFSYFSVIPYQ